MENSKDFNIVSKMYKLNTSRIDNWDALQAVLEGLNLHMTEAQYEGAEDGIKQYFEEVVIGYTPESED